MRTRKEFSLSVTSPRDEDVEMDITVSVECVDNGIGAYEYWGAKGTDTRWELEWVLESCPIPDEEIYDNERLCDHIQEKVEEMWGDGDDENY